MARSPNLPLDPSTHDKALRVARALGREEAARRFGVGTATLERALAYARLSPLVRRAIESALAAGEERAAPAA